MAAKPQDKTLVACPQCGHQQEESPAAISSNCRQCGSYLRIQELLHPVAKTAAPAPEQRHVRCFDCGAELEVPAVAQSTMCKKCSSYLDLKDYTINNAVSKNFKTHGRFTVEAKGYVFNTSITAREISIQYRYFRRSLGTIGETPVEVQVTARRAWQVKLESGMTLALGRDSIEARLARFVAVHERTLGRLGRRIDYVDLRYANGFAVRIPELRHEKAEPRRGRRTGQGAQTDR